MNRLMFLLLDDRYMMVNNYHEGYMGSDKETAKLKEQLKKILIINRKFQHELVNTLI